MGQDHQDYLSLASVSYVAERNHSYESPNESLPRYITIFIYLPLDSITYYYSKFQIWFISVNPGGINYFAVSSFG